MVVGCADLAMIECREGLSTMMALVKITLGGEDLLQKTMHRLLLEYKTLFSRGHGTDAICLMAKLQLGIKM